MAKRSLFNKFLILQLLVYIAPFVHQPDAEARRRTVPVYIINMDGDMNIEPLEEIEAVPSVIRLTSLKNYGYFSAEFSENILLYPNPTLANNVRVKSAPNFLSYRTTPNNAEYSGEIRTVDLTPFIGRVIRAKFYMQCGNNKLVKEKMYLVVPAGAKRLRVDITAPPATYSFVVPPAPTQIPIQPAPSREGWKFSAHANSNKALDFETGRNPLAQFSAWDANFSVGKEFSSDLDIFGQVAYAASPNMPQFNRYTVQDRSMALRAGLGMFDSKLRLFAGPNISLMATGSPPLSIGGEFNEDNAAYSLSVRADTDTASKADGTFAVDAFKFHWNANNRLGIDNYVAPGLEAYGMIRMNGTYFTQGGPRVALAFVQPWGTLKLHGGYRFGSLRDDGQMYSGSFSGGATLEIHDPKKEVK